MPDHPAEACQYVSHRIIADMADMNAAGGVRKHLQHMAAWLFTIVRRAKGLPLTPDLLPAGSGLKRVEAPLHIHSQRSEEHTSELQSLIRISSAVLGCETNNKHQL